MAHNLFVCPLYQTILLLRVCQVFISLTPHAANNSRTAVFVNSVPPSCSTSTGVTQCPMCHINAVRASSIVPPFIGYSVTQRVKQSMITRIWVYPSALAGRGPMRSMFIRINGADTVRVNLCVVMGTLRYDIFWQHAHLRTYRLTCSRMFGHGRRTSEIVRPPGNVISSREKS